MSTNLVTPRGGACFGALALSIILSIILGGSHGIAHAEGEAQTAEPVVIASKSFTESEVLGDLAALLLQDAGYQTDHRRRLGGTLVCFEALLSGDVDIYPDYTGTLIQSTLDELGLKSFEELEEALAERGVLITKPLGFNNTYAVGMLRKRAEELGISKISDLREHTELVFGFSPEFTQRPDSWPGLKAHYGLPDGDIRTMQHELSYTALASGDIDAMELYSTDAKIQRFDILALEDDRAFFPVYEAVYLYRADLVERVPEVAAILGKLEGRISATDAVAMNARADLEDMAEQEVAAGFLGERLGLGVTFETEATVDRVIRNTREHLLMVGLAMLMGIFVAIPIGFLAHKLPHIGVPLLGMLGIMLTIPSLALLVFMLPLFGIGLVPAVAALFLYCLLPMAWNTYVGLKAIPPTIEESAEALGLSPMAKIFRIELPMAARSIMAGIKISTVLTIGFAALGGFIGAGGYGEPIYNALQDNKPGLAFIGAIPAAIMAILALALGELAERSIVPRGLRLRRVE